MVKLKKYFENGKLKFEGEYLNGKKMVQLKNIINLILILIYILKENI